MSKLVLSFCLFIGCAGLTACNDSNTSKVDMEKATSDKIEKVMIVDTPEHEAYLKKRKQDRLQ